MTVNSGYKANTYVADGKVKNFAVDFKFFDNEIDVFMNDSFDAYRYGEDYRIEHFDTGGEIIFNVAPVKGTTITIKRAVPLNQVVQFIEGEKFPAKDFEYSLDRLVMMMQALEEKLIAASLSASVEAFRGILEDYCSLVDLARELENYYTKEESYSKDEIEAKLLTYYDTKAEVDAKIEACFIRAEALCVKKDKVLVEASAWGLRKQLAVEPVVGTLSGVDLEDVKVADFPFKAEISDDRINSSMFVSVSFDARDALSGNFAPVAISASNKIEIYAKERPTDGIYVSYVAR